MNEDNHYIKFTGKANIPEKMAMGVAYEVWIDGEITSITESNNQDGTKSIYYKLEPIRAEIKDSKGVITKTKDTRSMSQKMRALIKWQWENQKADQRSAEQAYEDTMNELIRNHIQIAFNNAKPKEEELNYPTNPYEKTAFD